MKKSNSDIFIGKKENVKNIIQQILGLGGSLMYWRMPNSDEKNLIVCNSGASVRHELSLEDSMSGFAFAPFDTSKEKYFFNADFVFKFKGNEIVSGPDLNNTFFSSNKNSLNKEKRSEKFYHSKKKNDRANNFTEFIQSCIDKTTSGEIEKIVPSKFVDVTLPENFDALKIFNALCEKHPNAFVSLVTSPETGTWIGASPELLVNVDAREKFRTVALAGTQKYRPDINLKSVAWTQKEIEEQALVSRYIINCFKKIRVREYTEHGPYTTVAGSLLHLRTDYEIDMKEVNFPQLGSVMLKLLHPTSAVCGMPHESARDFLLNNEGYDREFYSGYLGPVNFEGESKIFVNLRCVQIFEKHARIYAGAGITADSIAENEIEEIEMKIKTLTQVFNS